MSAFLIIGGVGVALLILTVVVDDIFDGIFESLDFGDGFLSGPAIAGFLSALGFGGALATSAGLGTAAASGVGIVAGLAVGSIAGFVSRSMMRMPTDGTPTTAALEGLDGVVISAIPVEGAGEVSVRIGGQPVKLAARSTSGPLAAGSTVRVTRALSPTSVVVEAV